MAYTKITDGNHVYYVREDADLTRIQRAKSRVYDLLEQPNLEEKVEVVFKRYGIPSAIGIGLLNIATTASAAGTDTIGEKLKPLLQILQDLALPLGIIVASWGLIEIIIGNFPQGKEKIKYAVVGFVGMFIIPEIFYTIRDVFGVK